MEVPVFCCVRETVISLYFELAQSCFKTQMALLYTSHERCK